MVNRGFCAGPFEDDHIVTFSVWGYLRRSSIWGFLKIRGPFLGVPIIRTIVFWGLYWGTLILGNYHIALA